MRRASWSGPARSFTARCSSPSARAGRARRPRPMHRSPTPLLRSGQLVDGQRQHRGRTRLGQQRGSNRDRPPGAYDVVDQQHRAVETDSSFSTVRASRSRARTADAASAVGGGPVTSSAWTSGSRPIRATCSATEETSSGKRRDGIGTTATGRSQVADQRLSTSTIPSSTSVGAGASRCHNRASASAQAGSSAKARARPAQRRRSCPCDRVARSPRASAVRRSRPAPEEPPAPPQPYRPPGRAPARAGTRRTPSSDRRAADRDRRAPAAGTASGSPAVGVPPHQVGLCGAHRAQVRSTSASSKYHFAPVVPQPSRLGHDVVHRQDLEQRLQPATPDPGRGLDAGRVCGPSRARPGCVPPGRRSGSRTSRSTPRSARPTGREPGPPSHRPVRARPGRPAGSRRPATPASPDGCKRQGRACRSPSPALTSPPAP